MVRTTFGRISNRRDLWPVQSVRDDKPLRSGKSVRGGKSVQPLRHL